VTKSSPLIGNHSLTAPRGDGEFRQTVDATRLEEGLHFLTARAYRHRTDGGPAVFSEFKRVVYIDRVPATAAVDSLRRLPSGDVEALVRSTDGTADRVHVLANVPATATEAGVLALVEEGRGKSDRIDRALFRTTLPGLAAEAAAVTLVTLEPSGTRNVQRIDVTVP
jgi:alpha-amylase